MHKYILLPLLAFVLPMLLRAQVLNCTVNAGIGNGVFCAGDIIKLDGNVAGNVVPGTLKWEKISGPACVLQYANQLQAQAIPSGAGMYTFKISATCAQGTAEQTVTHVVEPKDSPEAGPDQTVACYPAGGVVLTGFSIPPPGTLANWETSGGLGSVEGGVFKLFPGVCFSQPQTFTLTYVVENANHCKYTDSKKLTINQAQEPVFAKVFGGCGQTYSALGSCTGAGTGQWAFVGNAFGATFTSPTSSSTGFGGLTPGKTYTVRWTVTGGCLGNGSDEVSFTYPLDNTAPTAASITNLDQLGSVASGGVYLCGAPDSLLLFGTQPNPAAHETGSWTLNTQPCDPFLGTNNFPPAIKTLNDYTALVLNQGPGAFEALYRITDTLRGCYTEQKVYFELETPGAPLTFTASFKSCGGKELSPYNYGCSGISVTNVVWDPQDIYSTYPISFRELPDPGNNLRYTLKPGSYSPIAGPPGNPPQIQGGNCLNYTLHDFEYVLALNNSAPSGTYVYNIPMVYGKDISPCGNPTATIIMEVSTPPEPANAGSDVYICDIQTSLAGNTVATPQWFLISQMPANAAAPVFSDANNKNTDVNSMSPGATYKIGYRSYGGIYCNNFTDTVVVRTAQTAPVLPVAGANQTNVCFDMPVTLSATPNPVQPGTSGRWRLVSPTGGSVIIADPNDPVTIVNGLAANTTYTFEYKVKNGCDSLTSMVTVTTNNNQGPSLPNAGTDICLSLGTTSINLNGSSVPAGMSGQWIGVSGNPSTPTFANATNPATTATVSADGNYHFVWQVSKPGCGTVSDTVQATLSAPALAKIADSYLTICNVVPPVNVTLTAQSPAPGTGVWTLYDGPTTAVINNPTSPTTMVSNLNQGAYRFYWSVANGSCSNGKDSIAVYVGIMPPVASVGQSTVTLCGSSNGELTIQGNDPAPFLGFWTVEPVSPNIMSAGIDSYLSGTSLTSPNAAIKLRPGKTRLRWNILPGPPCATAPSVADMLVEYVPTAQTVPDQDTIHVCNSPLVTLNAISPGAAGTGTWTKISGPSVYGVPTQQQDNNPLIVGLTGGIGVYKFRYQITSPSCPATQDLITVINDSIFTAPFLGVDTALCVAGDLVLKGSNLPAGTFSAAWNKVSGPAGGVFLPNPNAQEVAFGPVQNGIYVFEYKITNGGCAFVDFVRDTVAIAQPFAGPDTTVCATSVKLTSATGGKIWTAQPNNPAPAIINQITGQITGMTLPGDYYFAMSDTVTKCVDIVKVGSRPVAQITQEPASLTECVGGAGTIIVSANNNAPGINYQWQSGSTINGPFVNSGAPVGATTFVAPSGTAGTYFFRAIADNGACRDTSIVAQITILQGVQATNLPTIISLCPGEKDTLIVSANGGQGQINYVWQSAASINGPWSAINGANSTNYILSSQTPGLAFYHAIASTTGAGCADTTSAVQVTVKTPPQALITPSGQTTICEGSSVQLNGSTGNGYSWQWVKSGLNIIGATSANYSATTAGTYTLVTTLNACSSTSAPVQIMVNPAPPDTIIAIGNASLCAGQNDEVTLTAPTGSNLSYQWYRNNSLIAGATGSTYIGNQIGSYKVVVTNTLTGCSSTSILLQVSQATSPNADITYQGNAALCTGDTVVLTGNSGNNLSYQWYLNGAPMAGATSMALQATTAGDYVLVLSQNGCLDTSALVTVALQSAPSVSIVSSLGIPFCDGLSTTLSTNTNFAVYEWSTGETTPVIEAAQSGAYTVTITNGNGCTNEAIFNISLQPAPNVLLTGIDTFCFGQSTVLTLSTDGVQYVWKDGNTTQTVRNIYPTSSGDDDYWVIATGANGCTRADTVFYYIKPSPSVSVTPASDSICIGGSILLKATGGTTYIWSGNPSLVLDTLTVSPGSNINYFVEGKNSIGCADTAYAEILVKYPPQGIAADNSRVCETEANLSATIISGQGVWTSTGVADVLHPDQPNSAITGLVTGANIFVWQVTSPPCTEVFRDTIAVILEDQMPYARPDFQTVLPDETVTVNLLANDSIQNVPAFDVTLVEHDENGTWILAPNGILSFKPNAGFYKLAIAKYSICNKTCPDYCATAEVKVRVVSPEGDLGETLAITPDATPGKNDFLFFDYLDKYPDNSILIFNRWGQKVYEMKPYPNNEKDGWRGTYKGKPLPAGTYFYILNLEAEDNKVWGNVLLVR